MSETREYFLARAVTLGLTLALFTRVEAAPSAHAQPSHFGWIRGWWTATHCQFLLLMFCLLLCLQGAASAQGPVNEEWTDADGTGLWSHGGNWNPPTPAGGPNGNFNVTIPCCTGGPTGGAILDVGAKIVNLTIQANGLLSIVGSTELTITGTSITNAGQLAIVDMAGFYNGGLIAIQNTVTLSGSGSIVLDSSTLAEIKGAGTLINEQTINGQGGGHIFVNLQNQGPNGLITGGPSTHPLILSGPVTNTGLISGQGFSTVEFAQNTVQNAGGTIDGGGNSGQVLLLIATVVGGTIGSASTAPAGLVSILNGVTITGTYTLTSTFSQPCKTILEGTITNNGKIVVTGGAFDEEATLYVEAGILATLAGTGQVIMSGPEASITGEGTGATLGNVPPHVINGGRIIGLMTVNNQSTILNPSTIEVVEVNNTGGTIEDAANLAGVYIDNGTIEVGPNPGTTLSGNTTLSGVTLTGGVEGFVNAIKATLNGLTSPNSILTTVQVNDNGKLTVEGTLDIDSGGELYLDAFQSTATVVAEGSVTMSGTGELLTSNSPNNDIVGEAGTNNALTINLPTVDAEGTIGDGTTMNVTIGASTIVSNGGYPLIFNVGNNHTFNDLGTLVETDSTINIEGNFANYNATTSTLSGGAYNLMGGTFQFPNANIVNNAAKLTFNGSAQIVNQNGGNGLANFSNNMARGTFELSGGKFETGGTLSNEGNFTVSANNFFTIGGTSTNYNQGGTTAVTTIDGRLTVPAGGLTNITGGTLLASGQFDGDVSVGNAAGGAAATFIVGDSKKSSALVTMSNNYTQLATGIMDVQIGGTTVGSQYSQLSVTGSVTLGGTLNVALVNKFKPVSGEQFTVINAPSGVTGTFATVNLPTKFQVVYNPTSVELEVQ